MSDNGIARLFGLCVCVVGCCILILLGDNFTFSGILHLIWQVLHGTVLLCLAVIGSGTAFIGTIWMVRPQRVFETIRRNRAVREAQERAS